MNIIWFWTLGAMLIAYAVLDGYDLGVGTVSLWLARTNEERRVALNAIGPVWNGNEVWLLAAGGMLVVSFPRVYAVGFSGFYLALMVVLWLLILRGVSIEFRHQIDHPMWHALWDTGFWLGSSLLALLLGVALGNVLHGLPIGAEGNFQGTFALMLNPSSLLTGILSLAVLAWHGTTYLRTKAEGALLQRSRQWSGVLWWLVALLVILTTAATFWVRPGLLATYWAYPVAWALPIAAAAGLAAGFLCRSEERDNGAFLSSTLTIVALLGCAAASVFPKLLISTVDPAYSLTVSNAASSPHALLTAFVANIFGMIGVIVYSTYVHRTFSGKVRLSEHGY
jgi:cytochrome d ubiquinol oxidase subunit II